MCLAVVCVEAGFSQISSHFTFKIYAKAFIGMVLFIFQMCKEENGQAIIPSSRGSLAKIPQTVKIHSLLSMLKQLS